jgi:hypothetical protein
MMIIYILVMLVVFLGLFAGLIIGFMAKEELKPGKRYLEWMKVILLLVMLVVFGLKNSAALLLIPVILIILFSLSKKRQTLYYYVVAVMLFMSWNQDAFIILVPLAFLYSIPCGSLYLLEHVKEKKARIALGLLRQHLGFLIIAALSLLALIL